jgi:hypothetical protein
MKTRFAHLTDLSDAARTYAITGQTSRPRARLSTDQALQIATDAETDRAALTVEEAQQDVEQWWNTQQQKAGQ